MGKTTELRQEIRETFVPFAEQRGFTVDLRWMPTFMCFRRTRLDRVQVFDIQWEKYGTPRFFVNYGSCGLEGVTFDDAIIKPAELLASDLGDTGRLLASRFPLTSAWFRQDRLWIQALFLPSRKSPESVVEKLMGRFDELELYWRSGIVGKHMKPLHR